MRAVSLLFHDVFLRDTSESGFWSAAADRYKLPLADFDAQLVGLATARADAPILARDLAKSRRSQGCPFLITVDDGGVSYYTVVAERLEELGWRGHCFVSTDFIGHPGFLSAAQIRELHARGHVIGTHSASHPSPFSACSAEQMRHEWSQSRQVLEDVLGHAVTSASVPGGYYSRAVAESAAEQGLRVLFTSEPTRRVGCIHECAIVGRYTIRRSSPSALAGKLAGPSPWARVCAWASWNTKGLVKPLMGSGYARFADWLLADDTPGRWS